jgi:hypothetical protein
MVTTCIVRRVCTTHLQTVCVCPYSTQTGAKQKKYENNKTKTYQADCIVTLDGTTIIDGVGVQVCEIGTKAGHLHLCAALECVLHLERGTILVQMPMRTLEDLEERIGAAGVHTQLEEHRVRTTGCGGIAQQTQDAFQRVTGQLWDLLLCSCEEPRAHERERERVCVCVCVCAGRVELG